MKNEVRKVPMHVISVMNGQAEFIFDMQSRAIEARTVRFAIDQVDARAMYDALAKFLDVKA
jgi:hypothetical protein